MSDSIPDGGAYDDERIDAESKQTVTNDAVAGETVLPGAGDGNNGPTGGSPAEGEPVLDENELAGEEIVGLDDSGSNGPVEQS
ncbi:hypothetical protein [Herbiconiux sp. L3-i23]|uniref:hypothetical protein n=1 Tax=Herbiconiux sp. L3-i23 TaxID=2905871 RepID=UPI00206FB096|nr:hypothetical protein [Herbiconiux sp. L3-i23]BDI22449.1 hypothetical protein L3i23_12250 [Herbiconiux sp. L3-i23]